MSMSRLVQGHIENMKGNYGGYGSNAKDDPANPLYFERVIQNFTIEDTEKCFFDRDPEGKDITTEHTYNGWAGIRGCDLLSWNFCADFSRNLSTICPHIRDLEQRLSSSTCEYCFEQQDFYIATVKVIVRLATCNNIKDDIEISANTSFDDIFAEVVCASMENRPIVFDASVPAALRDSMEKEYVQQVNTLIKTIAPQGLDALLDQLFHEQFPLPTMDALTGEDKRHECGVWQSAQAA